MPKRKTSSIEQTPVPAPSLASLDAALDLIACETFTRLNTLAGKFEAAAGVKLNDGVIRSRWEEAVKRYWVMKSIDALCCGSNLNGKIGEDGTDPHGEINMANGEDITENGRDGDSYERPLPNSHHPGAVASFGLDADEEQQWRRWSPKVNDVVLVELPSGGVWPGKVIDKRVFFQGRTIPRGNHFFPVRIYSEDIDPSVTLKARLIPFHLRPTPPLLASAALLSAYHHAVNPTSFDMVASNREQAAAYTRTHPGAGDEDDMAKVKADKESWKRFVNWLMDERRIEKLRAINEERERRLKAVAKTEEALEIECEGSCVESDDQRVSRKRRVMPSQPLFPYAESTTLEKLDGDSNDRGGIFRLSTSVVASGPTAGDWRPATTMASYIRPALSAPLRPNSPRRSERRRSTMLPGVGESSPGSRGGTYTPPRLLPSGDETAPYASPTSAPSRRNFDFISPLGPVKFGKLTANDSGPVPLKRNGSLNGSLEAVKEEREDDDGWMVVVSKSRSKRAGSAPCEKAASGDTQDKVMVSVTEMEL